MAVASSGIWVTFKTKKASSGLRQQPELSKVSVISGDTLAAALSDKLAFNRLQEALSSHDRKSELRVPFVNALGFLKPYSQCRKAASLLIGILKDKAELAEVRAAAAQALGNLTGKLDKRTRLFRTTVTTLIETLKDRSPNVRGCAAYALGWLEARAALPALAKVAKHDRGYLRGIGLVRTQARKAITRIGRPACVQQR
jgi:HEAT repeat protein